MSINNFIIMADIVKSRKQPSKELLSNFKEITKSVNDKNKKKLISPLTITLGDEFQGISNSLENAIEVLISTEEQIIKNELQFKLRWVINYGSIDTPINRKTAHEMIGKGLTSTRDLLEASKGYNSTRFNLYIHNQQDIKEIKKINQLMILLESIMDDWKIKDFPLITAFIENPDYKLVANILNKDKSLMWRRFNNLKINQYLLLKKMIFTETKEYIQS